MNAEERYKIEAHQLTEERDEALGVVRRMAGRIEELEREAAKLLAEIDVLKTELRAAEEVVRAMRTITEYPYGFRHQIREVLQRYDEAVKNGG